MSTLLNNFTSKDPMLNIAKGEVPHHEQWEEYGKAPDIDISTGIVDIWGIKSIYTGFPINDVETMEIFSTSLNDTVLGTGARTVEITNLLDVNGNEMPNVVVNMNGTTPVSLGSQTYYRGGTVVKVLTAGSSGQNMGDITLRHTTTTNNIFSFLPIGNNQSSVLAYTVPMGKTLYVNHISIQMARNNGAAGSAQMSVRARPYGGVFNAIKDPEISNSSPYMFDGGVYHIFKERTDIKLSCEDVSDNNTIITGDFGGVLVNNN